MDPILVWTLSVVAVSSWTTVVVLDRASHGTEFGRTGHLTVTVLWLLALGTFVVSSLSVSGDPGNVSSFFVAFNRAVLAASGLVALYREWRRFRAPYRGR